MDKLIAVKLTILLILIFPFFQSTTNAPSEEEAIIQVVKVCNAPDHSVPVFCNINTVNIVPDQNGVAYAPLDIHVANLVEGQDGSYVLPQDVPPMYIEYDNASGDIQVVGPVLEFEFEGMVDNRPIYIAIIDLPFEFDEPCGGNAYSAPYVSNARIVTSNNQGDPNPYYPIHDYTKAHEMFPCDIFVETCVDCKDLPCTFNPGLPQADFHFCIDCSDFGGGNGSDGGFSSGGNTDNTLPSDKFVEAKPNPFEKLIDLQIKLEENNLVNIEVYDTNGKTIFTKSVSGYSGNNVITLNSEQWKSGIYYCKVSSQTQVQTIKLVKK